MNSSALRLIFLFIGFCFFRRFLYQKVTILSSTAMAAHEELFEKTVKLSKDGKIWVSNISGDIDVTSWNEKKVEIKARKLAHSKKDLQKVKIEIIERKDPGPRVVWI